MRILTGPDNAIHVELPLHTNLNGLPAQMIFAINIHIGGPVFEQCLQIDCASFQSLYWKCRAFKRVILHVTPSVAVVICDRDNNLWLQ